MSIERELRGNWDNVYYPAPEPMVEEAMAPGQQPGDVLVAEAGSRGLPPSAYSGETRPGMITSDTGGGAAIGFRQPMPKRPTGGDLAVPMNPFARVVSKGANWFGDLVDKGASLYDTMQLIIPGGFDPDAKMNLPTDFQPRPSQIDPATGQMIPATMGFNPKEVTVGEVLKAIPVSEVIGVRGLARLAESLGTGNLPSFGDMLDTAGLWPVGSATSGVLKATAGTAGKIAKELAPVAGEMAIKSMEKLGTPVQMNIVPPGPSAAGAATKAMAPASDIGFYSAVEKAALNVQRNSGSGQAFLNDITKGENVKLDEIKWMGLDDFLKGKKNVTKQEVQDFVQNNRVDVQEVALGGEFKPITNPEEAIIYLANEKGLTPNQLIDEYGYKDKNDYVTLANDVAQPKPSKFGKYTLPGGENYREILLTLPISDDAVKAHSLAQSKALSNREKAGDLLNKPGYMPTAKDYEAYNLAEAEWNRLRDTPAPASNQYKSGHFDEKNVLAHIRVNDRVDADGKKMLLIEEVQSDWHQAGREKGYQRKDLTADQIDLKYIPPTVPEGQNPVNYPGYYEAFDKNTGEFVGRHSGSLSQEQAMRDAVSSANQFKTGVPDAPFKDTWYQLALKRALRYAADNGYDRVGLTTGIQQAERYDLSKEISKIKWDKETGRLVAYDKNATERRQDGRAIIDRMNTSEDQLANFIGKEAAQKLINETPNDQGMRELSGLDLKVGGEGMKKYYDDIYPKFLEKYGKKWGASVGDTSIETDRSRDADGIPSMRKNKEPVRYIDITPEMRKSVQKGQPLAAVSSESTAA